MGRIRIEKVELWWPDGLVSVFDHDRPQFDPLMAATLALIFWSQLAPTCGKHAVPIGFKLFFKDGNSYESVVPLRHHRCRQVTPSGRIDLGEHVVSGLRYLTGELCPGGFSQDEYAKSLMGFPQEKIKAAALYLANYAIAPLMGEGVTEGEHMHHSWGGIHGQ